MGCGVGMVARVYRMWEDTSIEWMIQEVNKLYNSLAIRLVAP